ncbi:hypothetical protein CU097_001950, partial [Rhizopus azygosporus]
MKKATLKKNNGQAEAIPEDGSDERRRIESDTAVADGSYAGESSGENDDDDDDDEAEDGLIPPIRSRKRFTIEQSRVLEDAYKEHGHPSRDFKEKIAKKFSTSPRRIQIWFQNRRAKDKRDKKSGDPHPQISHSSCHLEITLTQSDPSIRDSMGYDDSKMENEREQTDTSGEYESFHQSSLSGPSIPFQELPNPYYNNTLPYIVPYPYNSYSSNNGGNCSKQNLYSLFYPNPTELSGCPSDLLSHEADETGDTWYVNPSNTIHAKRQNSD